MQGWTFYCSRAAGKMCNSIEALQALLAKARYSDKQREQRGGWVAQRPVRAVLKPFELTKEKLIPH
jgi:hypothetical protein